MPITIKEIFEFSKLHNYKQVKWGQPFNDKEQGVYIVSTSDNPNINLNVCDKPQFDDSQINIWINKLKDFQIDNQPINALKLKTRLSEFWFPDESILYIGKAPKRKNGSGLSKRIKEYFDTEIGDGRPHSGGQWIKVLKNLNSLTVYYAYTNKPAEIEIEMMKTFMDNVSNSSIKKLYDKSLPIPFANIKYIGNKNHGLKNQRL